MRKEEEDQESKSGMEGVEEESVDKNFKSRAGRRVGREEQERDEMKASERVRRLERGESFETLGGWRKV